MTRPHARRSLRSSTALKLLLADADLLACCREAQVANQKAAAVISAVEALEDDDATTMQALDTATPLFAAYSDAVLRAGQLPARTPEGLRAKATLLLLHLTTDDDPVPLAASLTRDVVGRACEV